MDFLPKYTHFLKNNIKNICAFLRSILQKNLDGDARSKHEDSLTGGDWWIYRYTPELAGRPAHPDPWE